MAVFGPPGWRRPGLAFPSRQAAETTTPVVLSLTPNFNVAAGGGAVTITGLRFHTQSSGAAPAVLFGAQAATSVVVVTTTTITCVAPAAAGLAAQVVDVSVAIDGQTGTLAAAFSYSVVAITRLTPAFGSLAGGTVVLITGQNFVAGSSITVGGVAATGVTFIDAQHYAFTAPASTAHGFVDIVIAGP